MGIKISRKIKNYAGRNFKKERVPDKQSPSSRSSQMSKVRSANTKFEENFINLLRKKLNEEFSTHDRSIKGNPDIVFFDKRLCVFLDSDFWHGWQYSRWKHLLKNDFWREKIENNRKRDIKTSRFLRKAGWKVIRLWEHEIKNNSDTAISKIINYIFS